VLARCSLPVSMWGSGRLGRPGESPRNSMFHVNPAVGISRRGTQRGSVVVPISLPDPRYPPPCGYVEEHVDNRGSMESSRSSLGCQVWTAPNPRANSRAGYPQACDLVCGG